MEVISHCALLGRMLKQRLLDLTSLRKRAARDFLMEAKNP